MKTTNTTTTTAKALLEQAKEKAQAQTTLYSTARQMEKLCTATAQQKRQPQPKTPTTATSENKSTFADLLRNYETATRNKDNDPTAYAKALQELAKACTYSVLKKLSSVGGKVEEGKKAKGDGGHIFRTMQKELTADLYNLDNLNYAINNSTRMTFDKDGDYVQEVTDRHLWDAIPTLLDNVLNDGFDLLHTACVAILEETAKANTETDFLELPYQVHRLKKKVYIQNTNSIGGWEDVFTTAIQEVYKAIRRDVQASRQVQTTSKYTYLAEVVKDAETDTEVEVYKRLPKYSGLAYEINTDGIRSSFDGIITADETTTKDMEVLIEKLNLTNRQATILNLRLSGEGKKAIATYMGLAVGNIQSQLTCIQKKAVEIGFEPITEPTPIEPTPIEPTPTEPTEVLSWLDVMLKGIENASVREWKKTHSTTETTENV